MVSLEEIADQLELLAPESLAELASFVEYLKWKQGPAPSAVAARPWTFDFVEHFRQAMVTADRDMAGMQVQVGEAACGGETVMALWQHPPLRGSSIVEYQVPIPTDVRDLELHFSTGIRDGSHMAEGNVVAFRVFINDWRVWSDTQHLRKWRAHKVDMPALSGDIVRIRFITDGLGNHQWAWAVWGGPKLLGGLAYPGSSG